MQAGKLRQRLTIQRRIETQNSTGEVEQRYEDWQTVWGSIEPISGREYFSAQQIQSDITTRIRLRYQPGITPKMRIAHVIGAGSPTQFQYFDIESVLHINQRNREIVLMCIRREAEGFRTYGS